MLTISACTFGFLFCFSVMLQLSVRIKQSPFFLVAAKRIMTLPSVPEEKERHHSVAVMTNTQSRKVEPKQRLSWARRSTRWTLIADNVKV